MADGTTEIHYDLVELHAQNSKRTGVVVSDGIDIKIKKNKTRVKAGHTTRAIGLIQGDEEIDFNVLVAKDQPIVDALMKDDDLGIPTTFVGLGKRGDRGTLTTLFRLDGAGFTQYDNKYESKKETAVTVNGMALLFNKINTQFPTIKS